MKTDRLPREAYLLETAWVARRLLGCRLVRMADGVRLAGRIVETEAYLGRQDLGCHASKGQTERLEAMYGPPGHAYIYLVYGMHYCLNAVTQPVGEPQAVLIRALEPTDGVGRQRENRRNRRTGMLPPPDQTANGPAKLCQALGIDGTLYGTDLVDGEDLWIEQAPPLPEADIAAGRRIGIDYAGGWAALPLRFWIGGNPFASTKR
jgi:DNA-3-methyladenine glycosylase